MKKVLFIGVLSVLLFISGSISHAATIFLDDFNSGASSLWGNESGNWITSNGSYTTTSQGWSTSYLPFNLSDFTVDVDINNVWDGGIFLRSSYNGGLFNGISLITGGQGGGGRGLYWHIWQNGSHSNILNHSGSIFSPYSEFHLTVEVTGNTYSAYINGSSTPVTSLTTDLFETGQVALYNNKLIESFDNFEISDSNQPVPEPATMFLLGTGLVGIIRFGKKKREL